MLVGGVALVAILGETCGGWIWGWVVGRGWVTGVGGELSGLG